MSMARRFFPSLILSLCLAGACGSSPPSPPSVGSGGTGGGRLGTGGAGGQPAPTGGSGGAARASGGAGGEAGGSGGSVAGTGGSGTGGATADAAPEAAAPDVASTSGLTKIFDGTSFDNWEYDPKAWTLKDGAMVGKVGGGQSQAFTKKDYGSFRLIASSRMVNGNDHLGICFWGSRPAAGKYGFGGCLLVIPPNAAIWDYLNNKDNPKPNYQVGMAEWHKTEILADFQTGKVLVAVNGKLLHEYQDSPANLARRKMGPVGMQIHKAGTESEYKDIEIEADPTSDKLITLTP
jgi:hypothetical protein